MFHGLSFVDVPSARDSNFDGGHSHAITKTMAKDTAPFPKLSGATPEEAQET
jgi:hypothetical protein